MRGVARRVCSGHGSLLTWANPAASDRVSGWEVLTEEILSDHLYIVMDVAVGGAVGDRLVVRARRLIGEKKKEFSLVGGDPPQRGSHD